MKVEDVLALNAVVFWLMHTNIDRLMAERDYRMGTVFGQVMGGQNPGEFLKGLKDQIGVVFDIDEGASAMGETLDRAGLESLKHM